MTIQDIIDILKNNDLQNWVVVSLVSIIVIRDIWKSILRHRRDNQKHTEEMQKMKMIEKSIQIIEDSMKTILERISAQMDKLIWFLTTQKKS